MLCTTVASTLAFAILANGQLISPKNKLPCSGAAKYTGHNLIDGGKSVPSATECQALCSPGACVGFTYDSNQGLCFPMRSVTAVQHDDKFLSGFPSDGCSGECMVEGLKYEDSAGGVKEVSLQGAAHNYVTCVYLCLDDQDCNFWSYDPVKKVCWLFQQVTRLWRSPRQSQERSNMVLSGSRECHEACFVQGIVGLG